MSPVEPPSGYIGIIFTDIEDSSRMTNALGEVYTRDLRVQHNQRVRRAIEAHHGYEVKTLATALWWHSRKSLTPWPAPSPFNVRWRNPY